MVTYKIDDTITDEDTKQDIMNFLHSVHDDGGFFEGILNLIEIDKLNISRTLYFIDSQAAFHFYNVFRMMNFESNDDAKRWIVKAFLFLRYRNESKIVNNIFQKIKATFDVEKELIRIYELLETYELVPKGFKETRKELKMIWNEILPNISKKG